MRRFLRPAVSLANRLRFRQKFILVGMICAIAILAVGFGLHSQLHRVIKIASLEREGIAQIRPIVELVYRLQQHRGLSGAVIRGEGELAELWTLTEAQLDRAFDRVGASSARFGEASVIWSDIHQSWHEIKTEGLTWTSEENFRRHTQVISNLHLLLRSLADHYRLSFDDVISTHYLADTAIVSIPGMLEKVAQLRGVGTRLAASSQREWRGATKAQIEEIIAALNVSREETRFNVGRSAQHAPLESRTIQQTFDSFDAAVIGLIGVVETQIALENNKLSAKAFYELATSVIDLGYGQLDRTYFQTIEHLIDERIAKTQRQLITIAVTATALFLLAGYFCLGIYHSAMDSIRSVVRSAERYASGEMDHRVPIEGNDELRRVGESLNFMADEFGRVLKKSRQEEGRVRSIVDSALDGVIQMDGAGRVTGWSVHAEEIFGWTANEAVGLPMHDLIIPDRYRERHVQGLRNYVQTGVGPVLGKRIEIQAMHRSGREIDIELAISVIHTDSGPEFCAFVRDITARKKSEEDLRIAATAFEVEEGIVVTNAKIETLRVNRAFERMSGYAFAEVAGRDPMQLTAPAGGASVGEVIRASLLRDKLWQGELTCRHKSGRTYTEWASISAVTNGQGDVTNYVMTALDITQAKLAEKTIHQLAYYDSLTDLPNRNLFMDRLRQAVAIRERVNTFGALLWIDLDNFNLLNDAYGHDKGDLILKKIAQRLQSLVRVGDTVARLGGDEFVILFLGFDSSESEVINNIEILAEKLLASLREGVSLDGHSYQTQASAGATVFCGSSVAADELMKQAELALYNAKDAGRNTCRFFDPRMQAAVNKRIGVEAALRSAIHERQFVLHYQPQVDDEGVIVGAEALIRWLHPGRGLVPPAEFIPVAEDSGLIVSIGHWVLETACEQLSLWARQPGFSRLTLAVNVSAQQARLPGFVAEVSALIGRIEGAGKRLKLELTESLLLDNHEEIVGKMTALKKVGAMFSLDDFGTGYSSLSYLKSLPLDQLKIDKSFVNDVVSSASDAAIAQTIVSLANSLGLSVIAEGVETEAQRDRLLEIGCSNYQGYFFSKPLPLADFEKLVLSTRVASIAASGPRAVSTPVVKLSAA